MATKTTMLLLVTVAAVAIWMRTAGAADEIHKGKVVAVGENTITVLDDRDGDNDSFVVSVQTKITKNGKSAKLSEIRVGDIAKVTASAVEMEGKLVAKEISAAAPE